MEQDTRWPHALSVAALLLLIATVAVVWWSSEDVERWIEPARQTLAPYKRDLKHALERGLAGGPEHAIDACRIEAPRIAGSHARRGIRVGRTSHRLRNPANAPEAWQRPILEEFVRTPPDRLAARILRIDGDRVGYIEPILLEPVCLTCHGPAIAPDLATRIDALYPNDQAKGFALGELRGAFWVELERP